jgi:hypothetical protein
MQTFLPYASYIDSASVLDRARLGKQRVECLQILRTLTGASTGWRNHPATKMWSDNPTQLCAYGIAICQEWMRRGYKDTCQGKMLALIEPDFSAAPEWFGRPSLHASHRSNLLRKMPEHYSQFGWTEPTDMEYEWPSK